MDEEKEFDIVMGEEERNKYEERIVEKLKRNRRRLWLRIRK